MEKSSFNFAQIDVQDMLEKLDIRNIHESSDTEIGFSCPFGGHERGDETPSSFMNRHTTAWICFGCGRKGGNAAGFVADYEEVPFTTALSMLRQAYGNEFAQPNGSMVDEWMDYFKPEETIEEKEQIIPELVLENFKVDWNKWHETAKAVPDYYMFPKQKYMFDRGFTVETLEKWDFGYDESYDRFTIPVRNDEGYLVGFKGRSWTGAEPKYLVLGDRKDKYKYGFRPYKVADYLFGLDKCSFRPTQLIVCEGELDTISLHQAGFEAVGLGGSQISDRQINLLKRAEELILFLDDDKAGNRAAYKIADQLQGYMPVSIVPDHEGDPNSLSKSDIDDLISNSISSLTLIGD